MLVKCPKCGFDQPKDTYCANCGIEMDSFKPVKAPLWKRAIKSPLFSLLIFIALGYGSIIYLKNPSQFQTLNSTTNYNRDLAVKKQAPVLPPSSALTTPSPTPSPTNEVALTETAAAVPTASAAAPANPGSLSNQTETTSTTKSMSNESVSAEVAADIADKPLNIEAIKGPLVLEIRFIEAPMELVQRFHNEASDNSGGDSGEMNYAIVKNASKWLTHRSLIELDHFTKKVPGVKKKLQWFSGTQEPSTGAPFGLNFQVSIQERNGGHIAGDLFISRNVVEQSPEGPISQRKEFMTHFETDVGSLIGLSGIMPHVIIKTEDKDWLQDSLLKIFLSPAFQQNETELLILLQFKGDSK